MKFNILTIFPEVIENISFSVIKRACDNKLIDLNILNIRDFSKNKHKKVDDYPFSEKSGMLMTIQPLDDALEFINKERKTKIVYMSPRGKILTQEKIVELSKLDEITVICGHYEGIDQRVIDKWVDEEISIGDFVLTNGELPAMILIDSVSRLLDGVIKKESYENDSHYDGLLEYDQYTRPKEYKGMKVPEILFSGDHEKIKEYKYNQSLEITKKNRPDLYKKYLEKR